MILVNSFDVEPWWTTVPPCVDRSAWADMPDRSGQPLSEWLDLCEEAGVRSTFFVIGWYAAHFPARIAEMVRRGHEVGCHSLYHEDVATLSPDDFRQSTADAKAMIEDAAGVAIEAYRAPSFSIAHDDDGRMFHTLADLGFTIDSSVSTAARIHGGGFSRVDFAAPLSLEAMFGVPIFEIPVPGVRLMGRDVQLFGGGYLRLAPWPLLKRAMQSEDYQVLYVHAHDFDEDVPDLPGGSTAANLRRRLRIGKTTDKIRRLFAQSEVLSCGQLRDQFMTPAYA